MEIPAFSRPPSSPETPFRLRPKPADVLRAQYAAAQNKFSLDSQESIAPSDEVPENAVYTSTKDGEKQGAELTRSSIYLATLRALKNARDLSPQQVHEYKNYLRIINNLREYLGALHLDTDVDLRDIQVEILEDLLAHLEKGETQGFVVAPTGLGKTVIFSTLAKAARVPTLIVVPKQGLVTQTSEEVARVAPNMETGQVYQYAKEYDKQVTIITYASLVVQVKSGKIKPADYGLLILDEAHEVMGAGVQDVLAQFGTTPMIGFTATPQFDKANLRNIKHVLGIEFHTVGVKEAVEDGYLCGFRCIVVKTETSLEHVALTPTGDYNSTQLEKAVNTAGRNKAAVDLCQQQPFVGKRGIVNCAGIAHAEEMARLLNQRSPGSAAAIHSKMDKAAIKKLTKQHLSGEILTLTQAEMINEGYDNPEVEWCMNLRPTQSLVIAAQRGGRTLRLSKVNPDKMAYIVDFLDEYTQKSAPILYASTVDGSYALPNHRHSKDDELLDTGDTPDMAELENTDTPDPRLPPLSINVENITVITDAHTVMEMSRATMEEGETREALYQTYEEASRAAQDLGITTSTQYQAARKENLDPRLPSSPQTFYKEEDWGGWDHFLGKESGELYQTYEEASRAAQDLGITNSRQYQAAKKENLDPRLPSSPDKKYKEDWGGWDHFLGKESVELYQTYEEASRAAQDLGITTSTQYRAAIKDNLDPRLPSSPQTFYKEEDWGGWDHFLGKESVEPYQTYEEASRAAQDLGITNSTQYRAAIKENLDPRLPSHPDRKYKEGWKNWTRFLGKESVEPYQTYEEASRAAQDLEITNSTQYRAAIKDNLDPRLPSHPDQKYRDAWVRWDLFLGKKRD